jgi:hypothetical protein
VLGAVIAVIFLGDVLTVNALIGGAITLAGIFALSTQTRENDSGLVTSPTPRPPAAEKP